MHFHNLFAAIFVCSLLYLCKSEDNCLNIDEEGTCLERCPEGTFVYIASCDNDTMSQRTCRQPIAKNLGQICDFTRCDCPDPQLWDEAARICVKAEECSDQTKVTEEEEKLKNEQENSIFSTIDFEVEME